MMRVRRSSVSSPAPRPWSPDRKTKLLDLLQAELDAIGIPSIRNFQVPGGGRKLPLFLSQLPRTIVGVKWEGVPTEARLQKILMKGPEERRKLKKEMGAYSSFILILLCPDEPLDFPNLEPPRGIHLVLLQSVSQTKSVARLAAEKIARILQKERRRSMGAKTESAAGAARFTDVIMQSLLGAAESISEHQAPSDDLKIRLKLNKGKMEIESWSQDTTAPARSRNRPPEPPMVSPPPPASVQIVADQAQGILQAFTDLAPESHSDLDHELKFLVEEYRRGHYTACALRGGRTLEFVVYELSRRLDIQIQDGVHGRLKQLQDRLDRTGDLLGDFQVSEGKTQSRLRKEVRESLRKMAMLAMSLAFDFEEEAPLKTGAQEKAPRTVPTLVKKILKRYNHLDSVVRDLKPLIAKGRQGGILWRVLDARNQAAHAKATGGRQETTEATVTQLLDDIMQVTLKLSNVHQAINRGGQFARVASFNKRTQQSQAGQFPVRSAASPMATMTGSTRQGLERGRMR